MLVYFINKELLSSNFGDSGDMGVNRFGFFSVQRCLIYETCKVWFCVFVVFVFFFLSRVPRMASQANSKCFQRIFLS